MAKAIKVTGVKEIDRNLRKLEAKVTKKILRSSMRKGQKVIHKVAKANAPVGETGALKKGLKVKSGKRSKISMSVNIGTKEGWFQGPLYYGGFVSLGTVKQDPNTYLQDAFKSKAEEAKGLTMKEIKKGIDKAIEGL